MKNFRSIWELLVLYCWNMFPFKTNCQFSAFEERNEDIDLDWSGVHEASASFACPQSQKNLKRFPDHACTYVHCQQPLSKRGNYLIRMRSTYCCSCLGLSLHLSPLADHVSFSTISPLKLWTKIFFFSYYFYWTLYFSMFPFLLLPLPSTFFRGQRFSTLALSFVVLKILFWREQWVSCKTAQSTLCFYIKVSI